MKQERFSELESVVRILHEWADWLRRYKPKTGYPSSSWFSNGGSGASSFDDLCDQADNYAMEAVDCAVGNLAPAKAAAINRNYGLANVYRFPRDNYEQMLSEAHDELVVALRRKGIAL